MKSVNTLACKLCMQERIERTKRFKQDRTTMINNKAHMFSLCMCEGHFHTCITCGEKTLRISFALKRVPPSADLKKKWNNFFYPA